MSSAINNKLNILAGAAKYDVSCASSGVSRDNNGKGYGNATGWGICHSFTEDGRCISLLKVMMTNSCINDCAYCISRKSNDIPRATFEADELVKLTSEFYRRNYIEGLFLSSGIIRNADYTMERMVRVARDLRLKEKYWGYIHLKAIPGASDKLIKMAGMFADRLSVNMEIPTEPNLKMLAPEKDHKSIIDPMQAIKLGIAKNKEERRKYKKAPMFTPAGQSTQLIIGATDDSDRKILSTASGLYTGESLKRVYYSAYSPLNTYDNRLPVLASPPLKRENRLYQADWLLRFYHFSVDEIVNDMHPNLDLEIDPKLAYALRNPHIFPINLNTASYEEILRIPGVGQISAQKIIKARRYGKLSLNSLKKIGVVLKRARYFIESNELPSATIHEMKPENVKQAILQKNRLPRRKKVSPHVQLKLFE
ncbi:MAG: putative DNA modification/repair radical SAM protein [Bacteroidales bacterium]|nr:putative DNA modification/repair radical SAM protein [Bacteroidales bacterium]